MSLKEMIQKSSIANVAAGIVFVGGFIYATITGNIKLVETLVIFAAGYLFGRSVVSGERD